MDFHKTTGVGYSLFCKVARAPPQLNEAASQRVPTQMAVRTRNGAPKGIKVVTSVHSYDIRYPQYLRL